MITHFITPEILKQLNADGFLRLDWRHNNIKLDPQPYMLGHIVEATRTG
jgi:hypothetical protein